METAEILAELHRRNRARAAAREKLAKLISELVPHGFNAEILADEPEMVLVDVDGEAFAITVEDA